MDLCPQGFGDLNSEVPNPTAGTIDKDFVSACYGATISDRLQGRLCSQRDTRRSFERNIGWGVLNLAVVKLRHFHMNPTGEVVCHTENRITLCETRYLCSNCSDPA